MKYKSCHIANHGLCFFNDILALCCFSPVDQIDGQVPPLIYGEYSGQILSKEELFKRVHKHSDIFKSGGCPKECINCYHIEEKEWAEEDYIDYITITHFSNCNADCIYCSNNNEREQRTNNTYEILPVLKSFKEQGIIKERCELHIGGGEFTIYKECDEFLELFAINDFARVFVPTNAIIYSHKLFRAMNEATTYIIVSLDCGSKKLYHKIKRVDAFDKVIDSLKKYAQTEKSRDAIRLKYIIIPTINDNISEFKKFLKIAKKLGVRNLIIDIDARYSRINNYRIDDYFVNLAKKMNELALKQNFITEFYSFFFQSTNEKEAKALNDISMFIEKIKFKYFNKNIDRIKSLYINRTFGIKRRTIKKGEN